jgi:ParB-like chromosome segregation protein Spo0J
MAELKDIPVSAIIFTVRNPRSNPADDLDGLIASIGSEADPIMPQPPLVVDLGDGTYRLLSGERRTQAAIQKGWEKITCLVGAPVDPLRAHHLRLAENLHRKELHPLDKAAALKIAWLAANAEAMELQEQAHALMEIEQPPAQTLDSLLQLLNEHEFIPTHPAVTWDSVLDDLGIELNPASRKKLMAVLSIAPEVQEKARELDMSEAALRAVSTLNEGDQARLVDEIAEDPDLAGKTRRIARKLRDGDEMDEALAEVRGESDEQAHSHDYMPADDDSGDVSDAVLVLLEAANQVSGIATSLAEATGGELSNLSDPWNEYALQAIQTIKTALQPFGA